MIFVTHDLPVNVPGEPVLGRSDVWDGLVLKANNALPFVPSATSSAPTTTSSPSRLADPSVRPALKDVEVVQAQLEAAVRTPPPQRGGEDGLQVAGPESVVLVGFDPGDQVHPDEGAQQIIPSGLGCWKARRRRRLCPASSGGPQIAVR